MNDRAYKVFMFFEPSVIIKSTSVVFQIFVYTSSIFLIPFLKKNVCEMIIKKATVKGPFMLSQKTILKPYTSTVKFSLSLFDVLFMET